jgi:hypothetical protein
LFTAQYDDGHIFDINTNAFVKVIEYLAPNAVIVVHDTGLHALKREIFEMCSCDFENYCGAAHQHDNRNLLFYSF